MTARQRALRGATLAMLLWLASPAAATSSATPWVTLETGLELAVFDAPQSSEAGDSRIRVLRIHPEVFDLVLLNASATPKGASKIPRQWAKENALVAVINASMYQADYRRSVSLMTTLSHTNNPRLSKDNTVLAFDRLDDGVPRVQIIDRTCQDFDGLRERYGTLVQSIRMLSCRGTNVWQPLPDKWSTAAIGTDGRGRVLFIHARSPYSTHDLIDMLLKLPIDLRRAMYVEGGPQAQLYVESGDHTTELAGTPGLGFPLDDGLAAPVPIPNVIGVRRRPPATQSAERTDSE